MKLQDERQLVFKDALRYLVNARELLHRAGRQNGRYQDKKYVKLAGHAAWSGVLVAVDYFLETKGVTAPKSRKGKRWYMRELSKISRKINAAFLDAYDGLHLSLGYDGALNAKAVEAHFRSAKQVIELCRKG